MRVLPRPMSMARSQAACDESGWRAHFTTPRSSSEHSEFPAYPFFVVSGCTDRHAPGDSRLSRAPGAQCEFILLKD